jgi:hypothetical protein
LRAESWGRTWNRSRSHRLPVVSSVEDLKQELKSERRDQSKTKLCSMEVRQRNLRGIETKLQEDFLSKSRRRPAV